MTPRYRDDELSKRNATTRQLLIDHPLERDAFARVFRVTREHAAHLGVFELDTLWLLIKDQPAAVVAAHIEALASLRREGRLA